MDYLLPSDEIMKRMASEYAKIRRIGVPQKTIAFSMEEESDVVPVPIRIVEPIQKAIVKPVPKPIVVEPAPVAPIPKPIVVEPAPIAPVPHPIVVEPIPNPIAVKPLPEEVIIPKSPQLPQMQVNYENALQCKKNVALFLAFLSLMKNCSQECDDDC
ncbi:MAG TPA: hypothetical protein VJZ69_03675 [Clostridia bacterium]|nr:hypothetical protein [Clostridia bacterium]